MYSDTSEQVWQPDNYSDARARFLDACGQAQLPVQTITHPLQGPEGEELATDVAWAGPEMASRVLVMVSGVHGVEGFSGSAAQIAWIEQQQYLNLPVDTAVLLIHLINPWGVAHLRRYTEDNVDLCRNFLDFSQPLPGNEAYADIHPVLKTGESLGDSGQYSGRYLAGLVAEHGIERVIDLFMAGQYDFEDGFGFGGNKPTWSNTTLRQILESRNQYARRVCVIEYHTGLGPWAYGTLITMHAGEELDAVRQWFGPWVFNPSCDKQPGEEGYRLVPGHTMEAYKSSFPEAEVYAVTLEFGTYPPDETLALLVQEHLLVQKRIPAPSAELQRVKARLLEYHHPRDPEWRRSFWSRAQQVIRQAMAALTDGRTA